MIRNYLKIAWRNLLKQRSYTLINIGGLAIGMAAAVLIFLWVKNEFSFDNYHKDAERILRIKNYVSINKKETWVYENSPYLLGEIAKQQVPEVLNVCRITPLGYGAQYINVKGQFYKEEGCAYIDAEWFNVLDYEFIYGNAVDFNNHPFSVLLTESKSKKYFGNENAVGKIIRIDTLDYQVRGVLKDNPLNSSFQFDILIPRSAKIILQKDKENDEKSWDFFNYLTFLKLTPSAVPQTVAQKLEDIVTRQRDENNLKIGLTALKDLRFENDLQSSIMQHSDKKVAYIFTALGILLLLIACINYVNLTTARATLRAKEISMRKIVGAGKQQLFAQFITESLLTSILALLLTLCIAKLALPLFNKFTDKNFTISFASAELWSILAITLLVTILLTSIYPAILLSSFKPLSVFRGINILRIKDTAFRKGLVIVQFTISIALIVGTIVMYEQLQFINRQNAAYNRSQVLSFHIPFKLISNYESDERALLTSAFKEKLLSESNIADVSLMNQESIIDMKGLSSGSQNDWDGRDRDFTPAIAFYHVDTSFKRIMNLQIAEGRWYEAGNVSDQHNSILNETAVRELNIRKPVIGQRFVSRGDTGVIIGVVKDFYYKSLHEKIGPVAITGTNKSCLSFLVKATPQKTREAKESAEKVWKYFFASEPFPYRFLDDEFDKLYHTDRKTSNLIWVFAIIAIFISCLGLFGLVTFASERRSKEVGIRKILGAGISNILALICREFIYMILFSMIVAFPVAWLAMNKWLENFTYRISIAWWIFLLAAIITAVIAFATISFQAIKAAIVNPVKSLRTE